MQHLIKIQSEFDLQNTWVHLTTDREPQIKAGEVNGYRYVLGRPEGRISPLDGDAPAFWGIDVFVPHLAAGQRVTLDLTQAKPIDFKLQVPADAGADPLGYFGIPRLMGLPFSIVFDGPDTFVPNGAHFEIRLRIRGNPLCFDLLLLYYPDQPMAMPGTLSITQSHGLRENPVYQIPVNIVDSFGSTFLHAGDYIGSGQRRTFPVYYDRDRQAVCVRRTPACGLGLEEIGPVAAIASPGAYNEVKWLEYASDSYRDLFSWDTTQIGVSKRSGDAGDQEDQGYSQGFEPFLPNASMLTIRARLEAAWNQAKRPCHHLDIAGNPLDPEAQSPRLVYWAGQPHWHTGVSPNQLGKNRALTEADTHGWWGPDNEHFLLNNVAAAYELTGDMALHDELVHHAYLYLGSETVDPGLATTQLCIARALGWGCLAMTHCYRLLRDRNLAERVRDRVLARIQQHQRTWGNQLWDVRPNPGNYMGMPASQSPFFWMAYQQAVGAYGVFVAARTMRLPVTEWAARAAAAVVDRCYPPGNEILGLDANQNTTDQRYTTTFDRAWMPLALWVVIRGIPANEPVHAKALEIYNRIRGTVPNPVTEWSHFDDWLPPLTGRI